MASSDKTFKRLKEFITNSQLLEHSAALLVHWMGKEDKDEYDKKVIRALRRAVSVFSNIMLFDNTPSFVWVMSFASLLDNTLNEFEQLEEDVESYDKVMVVNEASGYILDLSGIHSRAKGLQAIVKQALDAFTKSKVDVTQIERIFDYLHCIAKNANCMYSKEEKEQLDTFILEFLKRHIEKGAAEVWQYKYGKFFITHDGASFKVYAIDELPWAKNKIESKYTPEWAAKRISASAELQKLLPEI